MVLPQEQTDCPDGHQRGRDERAHDDEARQHGRVRTAWGALHDVGFLGLKGQGQRKGHCGHQVDPQQLRWRHRQQQLLHPGCRIEQERKEDDRRHQDHRQTQVGWQDEDQRLDEVVVDAAAFLDGGGDGGEVVVGQHDIRRLLGDGGTGDAHGDADVALLERRRVVDPVARHGHDLVVGLQGLDESELVFGRDAGENVGRTHHLA